MLEEHKSDLERLFQLSKNDDNLVTIKTTVDTGFEWQAISECKLKISPNLWAVKDRGKIFFNIDVGDVEKVQALRSIDNIYIVANIEYFKYGDATDENKKDHLLMFKESVRKNGDQMKKCLDIWKKMTRFPGKLYPTIEECQRAAIVHQAEKEKNNNDRNEINNKKVVVTRGCDPASGCKDTVLSFRVTCERTGSHTFDSNQIASLVGGEMQDLYHWIVDLTSYRLEVLCKIADDEVITGLRVTPVSLHRRNIAYFGPTTLRATIAYNLLSLAEPKPADIIIDPMCGGGSIPIEGALGFTQTYFVSGDNHEKAIERSRLNFQSLGNACKSDLVRWNIMNLPFKDSYIDAIVTDMPFGKRMGSMTDNRVLYKKYLLEMARVVRVKHGKLVLLTYDRRSMTVALQVAKNLLKVKQILGVSMGGLHAATYVLKRTKLEYHQFKASSGEYIKSNDNNRKSNE